LILSTLLGLFAKDYPKIYWQRINQQQWINNRSNSSPFTYDFTSNFQEEYQSYRQQQQRFVLKSEENRKWLLYLLEDNQNHEENHQWISIADTTK
jgi:hypothetical protein